LTADCIFHSPQSLHFIAMPAPIYLKFLAGALTGGIGSVTIAKTPVATNRTRTV
jgi:hypothetical protein